MNIDLSLYELDLIHRALVKTSKSSPVCGKISDLLKRAVVEQHKELETNHRRKKA